MPFSVLTKTCESWYAKQFTGVVWEIKPKGKILYQIMETEWRACIPMVWKRQASDRYPHYETMSIAVLQNFCKEFTNSGFEILIIRSKRLENS